MLTVFELKGKMLLEEEPATPQSLMSYERTGGKSMVEGGGSGISGKLLTLISGLVNRNEYTLDLEEVRGCDRQSLVEAKSAVLVRLGEESVGLAGMTGTMIERV